MVGDVGDALEFASGVSAWQCPTRYGADRQKARFPWHIAVGAQRPPLNRTPALQQPKNQVPYEQQEVLVPNLGQLEKYRLGPMLADNADLVVLREKRSDIESDQIRALGNKMG